MENKERINMYNINNVQVTAEQIRELVENNPDILEKKNKRCLPMILTQD